MKTQDHTKPLSKEAQRRLVEFYRLLDRWDKESRVPGRLPVSRREDG